MTTYLVQNIETFDTITTFASEAAFDSWLSESTLYGIVSLDSDADGEYDFVALVAPLSGPDFVMDETTGEMEPVEDVDPAAELAAKMDIAMELDMNDVPQEQIVAMLTTESETTITTQKPRKARKTKTKSRTKAKGANMSQPKKIRNFEILVSYIEANPGVSRTTVFADGGLQSSLRTPEQVKAIAKGDKAEVKRWNRRLNFLIRESKRQGVDINIERKGRVAHYTIVPASGQLELPFDEAAEKRNAAIVGDVNNREEVIETPVVDPKRAEEEANQNLSFEALLATLDEDAATVTSDDQVAFEQAQKMLK